LPLGKQVFKLGENFRENKRRDKSVKRLKKEIEAGEKSSYPLGAVLSRRGDSIRLSGGGYGPTLKK